MSETVNEVKTARVYNGEDYVHYILKSNAGEDFNKYLVIYQDAHGSTNTDILSEADLNIAFSSSAVEEIIKILK